MCAKTLHHVACVTLAVLGLALCAGPAAADTTIYQDTFTADNGTPLNGHRPDVTPGASWSDQSGSSISSDRMYWGYDGNLSTATLPFTPGSAIYTLSMEINLDNYYGVAFGFSNTAATTSGSSYTDLPFMIFNNPTPFGAVSPWSVYAEPTYADWESTGVAVSRATVTPVSIVLDTRHSNWTASWYVGSGSTPIYSHTYTDAEGNPTISYIELERFIYSTGSVDNLTLSSVPEPNAVPLLGTGLVTLLAYAWRRRK